MRWSCGKPGGAPETLTLKEKFCRVPTAAPKYVAIPLFCVRGVHFITDTDRVYPLSITWLRLFEQRFFEWFASGPLMFPRRTIDRVRLGETLGGGIRITILKLRRRDWKRRTEEITVLTTRMDRKVPPTRKLSCSHPCKFHLNACYDSFRSHATTPLDLMHSDDLASIRMIPSREIPYAKGQR